MQENHNQQQTCLSGQSTSGYVTVHVVCGVPMGMTYQEFLDHRQCVGIDDYDAGSYVLPAEIAEKLCEELQRINSGIRTSIEGPLEVATTVGRLEELINASFGW